MGGPARTGFRLSVFVIGLALALAVVGGCDRGTDDPMENHPDTLHSGTPAELGTVQPVGQPSELDRESEADQVPATLEAGRSLKPGAFYLTQMGEACSFIVERNSTTSPPCRQLESSDPVFFNLFRHPEALCYV